MLQTMQIPSRMFSTQLPLGMTRGAQRALVRMLSQRGIVRVARDNGSGSAVARASSNLGWSRNFSAAAEKMQWFRVPPKVYFKPGCLEVALQEFSKKRRAFIVTDKPLYDMGVSRKVTETLDAMKVQHQTYFHIEPEPDLLMVQQGLRELSSFNPDVIFAIGGGSSIDAAKVMRLLHENPSLTFEQIAARCTDARQRDAAPLASGTKADLVCIPTTSGTGSDMTPFSTVTDPKTGAKHHISDYALTPSMSIVDSQLVADLPPALTAAGGFHAFSNALEAYVSRHANDFTRGLALEALSQVFKFLRRAHAAGAADPDAREALHSAATMAGMAAANSHLGVGHALAGRLGAAYHLPPGVAAAALASHVVAYNAADAAALRAYAAAAARLGLAAAGGTDSDKVRRLISEIEALKSAVGIPPALSAIVGAPRRAEFLARAERIAQEALADSAAAGNPRRPAAAELAKILAAAWEGPVRT